MVVVLIVVVLVIKMMILVVLKERGNGTGAHKTGTRDKVMLQQIKDIQKW